MMNKKREMDLREEKRLRISITEAKT